MADVLSSFIGQIKIGDNVYPVGSTLFGLCSTDASEAAKVVNANNLTTASFTTLATGITVHIKFANANSASSPTLQVGNTTAKPISNPGGTIDWSANSIISFTYDGTNWVMNGGKSTATVSQGTNSGEIVIDGTTVTPKNLNNAAYKDVDTSISSNSTSINVPTSAAVAGLVSSIASGITGAMHFIGTTSTTLTDGATTSTLVPKTTNSLSKTTDFIAGDVVLYEDAEFVWGGSAWKLLGDEGSYALKTSTVSVGSASNWSAGSAPTLGTAIDADDITAWSTNTPTGASVANGTLTITAGSAASLSYTARSIPNVTNAGSAPSLTITATTVVKP